MARVRIYLLTYRRNVLLRRAVDSLLRQTFRDWFCEIHNDDPADDYPEKLVNELSDSRIRLVQHNQNLGAVRSFNQCWQLTDSQYMSILEDDNWWEVEFLERMVQFMDANPKVFLAWSNMRLWRELSEGAWREEGTIWPVDRGDWRIWIEHEPRQLLEPVHSQGAMLVRVISRTMKPHPESSPLFMIEAIRERLIGLPVALLKDPLANFALTIETARKEDLVQKIGGQIILVRDFLRHYAVSPSFFAKAWRYDWWSGRYALRSILLGALLEWRLDLLSTIAMNKEFWKCLAWLSINPATTVRAIHYAYAKREIASFLASRQ